MGHILRARGGGGSGGGRGGRRGDSVTGGRRRGVTESLGLGDEVFEHLPAPPRALATPAALTAC
eukprot:scaffold133227_cov39-Phaeocystis_antarctica.AAC.1